MGVIIKYLIDFQDAGLKVSNDLTLGDFTLDASIDIEMTRGVPGSSFNIQLFDLPKSKASSLDALVGAITGREDNDTGLSDAGKKISIKLGYFDGSFETVLDGIVDSVRALVQDDKLVTIVKGLETATHALHQTPFTNTFDPPIAVDAAILKLMSDAKITGGEVTSPPLLDSNLSVDLGNRTVRGEHIIDALSDLARYVGAEVLVSDKKVRVGKPITDDTYSPEKFVPGINLGTFEPFKKNIPDENTQTVLNPLPSTTAEGFTFVITGDPKLRPGNKVNVALDTFKGDAEYRIHSLTHNFNTNGGYTCKGRAVKVKTDGNAQRRERYANQPSTDSIVEGLNQIATASRKQRPSIEIGQVKANTAGAGDASGDTKAPKRNTSHVYYGQVFERTESQPSIHAEVQNNDNQLAKDKPIVSAFAWHKCGLAVPVYPGMKAVLGHNLGLEDDALVTGFIWSDHPAFDPLPNKKGDWWLSLPVFTSDDDPPIPPPDDTKITNDLTAKSGLRVIEVGGLKITVGKLQTLGTRPTEGADAEFLIEHKKAKISIAADGSIEIVADADGGKGKINIASSGDISMTATGGVTMKIGASAVDIS